MGGNKTEVSNEPWSAQQPYLENMFGYGQDLYNQGPLQYYPGQTWVDPNQLELLGRSNALGYGTSPQLQDLIGAGQSGITQALQGGLNPYLEQLLAMGNREITDQYLRGTLPGIQTDAIAAGGLGSSRQGVAEGLAAEGASKAMGDFSTKLLSDAYGQNLDQQSRAWLAANQMAQLGFLPSQTQQQVGGQYNADTQLMLQDAINRWNYEQQAPWDLLSRYQGVVGGQGYGSQQTSSASTPGAMLGTAGMLGYGLYDWLSGSGGGGDNTAYLPTGNDFIINMPW